MIQLTLFKLEEICSVVSQPGCVQVRSFIEAVINILVVTFNGTSIGYSGVAKLLMRLVKLIAAGDSKYMGRVVGNEGDV